MSTSEQQTLDASITAFNKLSGQLSGIAKTFHSTLNLILEKQIGHPDVPKLHAQLKRIYAQEEQIVKEMNKEKDAMLKIPKGKITESQEELRNRHIILMKEEWECLREHYVLMENNKK